MRRCHGAIVKLALSEHGKDAPGFVWAGISNAEEKWDTDRIYYCPILREEDRAVAYLPPGVNIFRIFWTGGEDAKYGESPDHWEERYFRIRYVNGKAAPSTMPVMSPDEIYSAI